MANYKPFKMKGHALPGINQQEGHPKVAAEGLAASSPAQAKTSWRNKLKAGWDTVRSIGTDDTFSQGWHEYQGRKKALRGGGGVYESFYPNAKATKRTQSSGSKKSPAKCPLIAAIPAITGAIGAVSSLAKKKEQ